MISSSQSKTQQPGSPLLGGLAVVLPQRHIRADHITFLHGLASQYVNLYEGTPLSLPYRPESSHLMSGTPVGNEPPLRVDAYRAPQAAHPRAHTFDLWVQRSASQASRLGLGALHIPAAFSDAPPGLIVTDVDSTLIAQEVIEEIADFAGTRDQVKEITDRAMNGEIDFAQSLRERVATLAGVSLKDLHAIASHVTIHAGAQTLVDTVHHFGGKFGVVSGGFEEVVSPLVEHLGIDFMAANRLESAHGVLTGRVVGDIVTAETKVERLRQWASLTDTPLERTVAVGDGANDIPMMQTAGLGVAFCAKPAVRAAIASELMIPRLDTLTCLF